MSSLRIAIIVIWAVFWLYWLISAFAAKASVGVGLRGVPLRLGIGLVVVLCVRGYDALGLRSGSLSVHALWLELIGLVLLATGLAFAVWARVHLGRNWGMPMTQRVAPELITSGPYARVRHPIYSGLILAALGTALAVNLIGVGLLVLVMPYFIYAARTEEHDLAAAFPEAYPAYRAQSKLLIPFIL